MKRRTHKKTKTGCLTCKRRRIKCDEDKPKCRNCRIHDASECTYEATGGSSPERRSPSAFAPVTMAMQPSRGVYSLEHMELLLHFVTSTALTFSSHDRMKELWSAGVPRLGLSFPYVLHAALALSSMHLAHERPSERRHRWACAIELQQQAVASAQKAMENISADNCSAVFMFSALTCVFSLARGLTDLPRDRGGVDGRRAPDMSSFLEWVCLYRGSKLLLSPPYEDVLHSGPLAPMFEIGMARRKRLLDAPAAASTTMAQQPLSEFRAAIHRHADDPVRLECYDGALDHLQRSYLAVHNQPKEELESMDIFAWMFSITDGYISLLKQRDAIALAIFASFAVLIRELRHKWWTLDWSEWCISLITSELKGADVWLLRYLSDLTR